MSEYGLLGNYSASPSLGNYGGLSQGASTAPASGGASSGGKMAMIGAIMQMLQSKQQSEQKQGSANPAVIGGGSSPVSSPQSLFNYNPASISAALQAMIKQSRGF